MGIRQGLEGAADDHDEQLDADERMERKERAHRLVNQPRIPGILTIGEHMLLMNLRARGRELNAPEERRTYGRAG